MATKADDAKSAEETPDITYVGSPENAPTVYADNCAFATSVGPTMRLQLVEFVLGARDSTSPGMKVRYVQNLVMPLDGFRHMVDYFSGIIARADAQEAPDGE
jgi:hypothetical protein